MTPGNAETIDRARSDGRAVRLRSAFSRTLDALSADDLRRLLNASHEINSTIELDDLLPRVLEQALEPVAAETASMWLIEGETLRCAAAVGEGAESIRGRSVPLSGGMLGETARRGTPLLALAGHGEADDRAVREAEELTIAGVGGVILVPLVLSGECFGVIQVVNRRGEAGFESDDLPFLQAFADDAAASIRNARLFEAERRANDLKALLDFSAEISSSLELERVVTSIVNLAGRVVPFERCVLALWHDERLRVRGISGEAAVDRKSPELRELERFLAWAAESSPALAIEDAEDATPESARLRGSFPDYLRQSRARALLLLPISDAQGKIGSLLCEFAAPTSLSGGVRDATGLLVGQAALALRNAELYANVPFINLLEPIREKKQALVDLPGPVWLAYAGIALVILLVTAVIRLPLRIGAVDAAVRDAVQQPVRAGVAGLVDAVMVREGQRVVAGAPVAHLRNEELATRIREADAGLAQAQREAAAAQARSDLEAAMLARVRAAQWADTRTLLAGEAQRAQVLAPVSGVVLTPRVEERTGDWLQAGDALAWIGDPDRVELNLHVDQKDLGDVAVGDRVRARVNAVPGVTFEGRVTSIAPRDDSIVPGLFTVRALLDNRERMLRPGMTMQARILARSRPVASLALRAPVRWLRMHLWW